MKIFLYPLRRFATAAMVALVLTSLAVPNAPAAIVYDLVTVGNAGNAADTTTYGGVAYEYQIGKYDVTIGQYTEFLNAVAATDPYSLYNANMFFDGNIKGIQRGGSPGSYTYSVIGSANRPITYVSWFDAARFANWMTNGQGTGSTETGAYTLNNATSGNAVVANSGAAFRLPTNDEWYKAAYYSPVKGGVGSPGYYAYATQSDSAPGNTIGSGANQANYKAGGVYSVTLSGALDPNQNYLTDVGAFTNSESFYGTFDQSGNVNQWNDLDGNGGGSLEVRGGSWLYSDASYESSSFSSPYATSNESMTVGFRLASPVAVPEPSTWVMAAGGLACAGWGAWRRRRAR